MSAGEIASLLAQKKRKEEFRNLNHTSIIDNSTKSRQPLKRVYTSKGDLGLPLEFAPSLSGAPEEEAPRKDALHTKSKALEEIKRFKKKWERHPSDPKFQIVAARKNSNVTPVAQKKPAQLPTEPDSHGSAKS